MKKELCSLTISMAFLALSVALASAQEPSPAGGGYLDLDKKDVFAATENDKVAGAKFEEVTVEAWIYPTSFPWPNENRIIVDGGSFELLTVNTGYSFMVSVREVFPNGAVRSGVVSSTSLLLGQINELNKWHHISGSYDGSSGMARRSYDGKVRDPAIQALGDLRSFDYPVCIGGWKKPRYFDGFIDEVRISNVVRYKEDFELPNRSFEADENTVALWHFDERKRATRFEDASGNGITLFLGADGQLPVEPSSNSLTTWGKIKSKY